MIFDIAEDNSLRRENRKPSIEILQWVQREWPRGKQVMVFKKGEDVWALWNIQWKRNFADMFLLLLLLLLLLFRTVNIQQHQELQGKRYQFTFQGLVLKTTEIVSDQRDCSGSYCLIDSWFFRAVIHCANIRKFVFLKCKRYGESRKGWRIGLR